MANNRELSQFASFVEVGISSIGFTTSVGIGKTNPQFNLDVAGDINFTGTFYQGGTQFIASRWSATGSDIYRLSKVGINTSIVSSALTVNGDVSVSGVVTATTFIGAVTGTATTTTNIPNLTGAITSNNTTTSLGSFTSANLSAALTDETGSGSAVFATSPTLVTPALGAASATSINVSGIVTATTFVGALTGTATSTTNIPNLTGDISSVNTTTTLATVNSNVGTFGGTDAISVVTVNGKGLVTGISTVAPNNGTLSLGVSGTGLSGSASFTANQSGASTFTVTSNATSANTASAIVARDASGNFSAGTITASLTGTATSTTNIPNLTGDITSVNSVTSIAAGVIIDADINASAAIAVSKLAASTISGIALGNNLNALTISTGLSGSSYNGSGAVTIAIDSTVATLTGIQTFTNKTLTSPTLTTPVLGTPSSGTLTNCTFPTLNQNTTGNAATVTTNANLTGHVTSVGNAAVLGSFSSANLATALTDETGSGSAVFATSPTLVTPVLGAATATSVTVSGAITANSYNVGTAVGISTTITTVATTAVTTIDSFATATFRSTRAQVQITQSTNYQASDVLIIHDGTTASIVEYGSIATNDYLGTFSASVSGGNCLLRINMSSATSATVKVLSQRITV